MRKFSDEALGADVLVSDLIDCQLCLGLELFDAVNFILSLLDLAP